MANIDAYRSRIGIYKRVYTANSVGGFAQTLTEIATCWCKITPLTGREKMLYAQVYPTAQYKITMRYRPDVNTEMKLYRNNKYWNILSVNDVDTMQDELEILAEESHSEQV